MSTWHLECSACDVRESGDARATVCPACGQPFLVRYDSPMPPRDAVTPRWDMWRYAPVLPLKDGENPGVARRRAHAAADVAEAREGDRRRAAVGEGRRTQSDGVVQGARHERRGDARARRSACRASSFRRRATPARRSPRTAPRPACRCGSTRRRPRPSRFSTRFARSARICSSCRDTLATPASRRARSPRRAATSTSRRCASRIASRGRRRWASSSPSSSTGSCRRTSSIRPAAARG